MNLDITPIESINEELKVIDTFLTIESGDDVNTMCEYGERCSQYIVRTGKLLADAKYHYNIKIKSDIITMLAEIAKKTPQATSKTVNQILEGICSEERYLVDYADRMNRAATHRTEWMRTLISKEKAVAQATRGGF